MFHALMRAAAPCGHVIVSAAACELLEEREVKVIKCLSCIGVADTECGITDSAMDTKAKGKKFKFYNRHFLKLKMCCDCKYMYVGILLTLTG